MMGGSEVRATVMGGDYIRLERLLVNKNREAGCCSTKMENKMLEKNRYERKEKEGGG